MAVGSEAVHIQLLYVLRSSLLYPPWSDYPLSGTFSAFPVVCPDTELPSPGSLTSGCRPYVYFEYSYRARAAIISVLGTSPVLPARPHWPNTLPFSSPFSSAVPVRIHHHSVRRNPLRLETQILLRHLPIRFQSLYSMGRERFAAVHRFWGSDDC